MGTTGGTYSARIFRPVMGDEQQKSGTLSEKNCYFIQRACSHPNGRLSDLQNAQLRSLLNVLNLFLNKLTTT